MQYLEDGSPDFEKCMIWIGARDTWSYGLFGDSTYERRAHRFIYTCFYNEDISTLLVCHNCDTPPCVNPYHLFLGTNADNVKDRDQKGRNVKGQQVWTNILTPQNIEDILLDIYYKKYQDIELLGKAYGVHKDTIREILNGKNWKDEVLKILKDSNITLNELRDMIISPTRKGDGNGNSKLTDSDVSQIKKLLRTTNMNQRQIATQFNIHYTVVNKIKTGRNWSHIL